MSNFDLDDLAAELAEFAPPEKKKARSASEERVIAGFEEIQRFTEQHGRAPQHGEDRDIFERLYAVRLDRLRALPDCRALLEPLDHQSLLAEAQTDAASADDAIDIDDLAAELAGVADADDITVLRHVRTSAEKRAAEEIADRKPCEDFDGFKELFDQARSDLSSGLRVTRPFGQYATIEVGHWFILDGQMAYVAEEGEEFDSPQGKKDARLRVIFSNGTESNLLRLSLARALYKDETARRITDPDMGPLFSDSLEEGDLESGTIYVLRSLSENPYVAEHRDVIHKIGVTGGKVETRIANAEHDSTYLLAKVEVIATYKLAGINRSRMENLFHRLFAPARLNITINDRFGHPVQPEEWFLVPLHVIDEAVQRIRDGSITEMIYEPQTARLISR
ncbi:GIY-YIG nuclease family protein [Eoetvoesiella caeni]|uniref:T5orf172 domain-containing protein n=1 Tax=Eoetvoesiella caeni TaxID=645616 RepID=A0A366HG43_9BURK|nr:GIY-YIG nuclease family protein [Eoetvoesiella caeni]MCI2808528.1 GIY-YIG nuclease family protein [Eoetvoesiella caeni]NYT55068.1 GIY-YIG nuclease family protein [Eoetvoesiella caeni]RBP40953.1 T5orf172 domain-containing protein [Eoetvoesiella caeni]